MANTTNTTNTTNNTMTKEQRIAKAAEFQAARLTKATEKFEAAKVYTEKKTGVVSEGLREAKSIRIAACTIEELAKACEKRAAELSKTHASNSVVRYIKKEVKALVFGLGNEKLPLFVDCNRGEYKIDAAIKYVCSASRNEAMKGLLKDIKKASK